MKKLFFVVFAAVIVAGCQGRQIWDSNGQVEEATSDREVWDDNGEMEEATTDREIWDSNGKMDTDGRKIWNDSKGKPVIQ